MSHDDPQFEAGPNVPPDDTGKPDAVLGDASWMAPDPPPIPDRIQNAVNPKRPSLPAIPKVNVKVERRWFKRGLVAAGVMAVVAGIGLAWPDESFSEAQREQWEALCEEHAAWFGPFVASVKYEDKAVMKDVGLDSVVAEINAAENYAPQTIADAPGATTQQLQSTPPAAAQAPDSILATQRAHEAMARVQQAFDQWPVARALREHQAHFKSHGWDRAAQHIQHYFDQGPPHGPQPVGPILREMAAIESHTRDITELSRDLDIELETLAQYDDPVFARLIEEVKNLSQMKPDAGVEAEPSLVGRPELAAAQFRRLSDRLRPLESFARRFCALIESGAYEKLDHPSFRGLGQSYALLEDETADANDVFRAWLTEYDGYQKVRGDWRLAWSGKKRQALADLAKDAEPLAAGDHPLSKSFDERLNGLGQRIDALLDAPLVSGAQPELDRERQAIDREVDALAAAVEIAYQQLDAASLIATLREASAGLGHGNTRSDAVDARWNAERSRLAEQLERRGDRSAVENQLAEARGHLMALIDPSADHALPPAPIFTVKTTDKSIAALLEALNDHAAAQREAVFQRALAHGLPVDPAVWNASVEAYRKQCAALENMFTQARCAAEVFEQALPLNDPKLPGNIDGPTGFVAALIAWNKQPGWSDPAIAAAGEPIRERIAYLQAIGRESNPEVLTHLIVEAEEPSAAFTAWRRWYSLPTSSPATPETLTKAQALYDQMLKRAKAMSIRDADRAAVLTGELVASGRQYWLAAFLQAQDAKNLAAIADTAPAWQIDARQLPTVARFNLLLHRTQQSLSQIEKSAPHDAQVFTLAQALIDQARDMDDHPEIAALLRALEAAADPEADHREHLVDAGPGAAGWRMLPGANTAAVTYQRGPWKLSFVRIDPAQGPSFYLGTTELPVGLAVDLTDSPKSRREWAGLLPNAADGDTRKGPRSWSFTDKPGGPAWAVNAGEWLADSSGYPDAFTPSPPSPHHPVNYLNAEAAGYLAARLSCRLPTIDQWLAAHERHPVPAGTMPNLRDTTWARHAEYRRDLIAQGAAGVAWANSDVFRPTSPDGPTAANSTRDATEDSHPINDAELWFNPVTNGPARPSHLVGNVAEFVTTRPVDPTPLLDREVPMPVRRATFRDRHKNDFAVLGGSALSPASTPPDEPQPFNVFTGARGYADVGVRLAFVAPMLSPADQARAILKAQAFLQTP